MTNSNCTITYSKQDRDYSAFVDGEYLGSFSTQLDAQIAIDDYLTQQAFQQGREARYAR